MTATKVLLSQGESDSSCITNANQTMFFAAGCNTNLVCFDPAPEANTQVIQRAAGIFSQFTLSLKANGIAGTTTFTFRINAADANMSISIPASTTGNFAMADTSITDTIAAGDKTGVKFVPGATTGTCTVMTMKTIFTNTSSDETITRLGDGGFPDGNFNTASTTRYEPIAGEFPTTFTSTESLAKVRIRKPGVIRNLSFFVKTNARSTATSITLRLNGANAAITKSVAAGVTGWQEDTTNSVTVAVNDDVNWAITTSTGTGAFRVTIILCDFVTTDGWFPVIAAATDAANQAAALTRYLSVGGILVVATGETNLDGATDANFTFAELTANVTTNGIAAVSTVTLRANIADTALVASTTASTTGIINDSTHTVTNIPTDRINYKIVTGGASGNLAIKSVVLWGQEIIIPQTVMVEWEEA